MICVPSSDWPRFLNTWNTSKRHLGDSFVSKLFVFFSYQMEKEKKNNCRPLAAERPAAAMFILFVASTRIFRAKVVYMVLGSYLC